MLCVDWSIQTFLAVLFFYCLEVIFARTIYIYIYIYIYIIIIITTVKNVLCDQLHSLLQPYCRIMIVFSSTCVAELTEQEKGV